MKNQVDLLVERLTYLKERLESRLEDSEISYDQVIPQGIDKYTWISASLLKKPNEDRYCFVLTLSEGCKMITDEVEMLFEGSEISFTPRGSRESGLKALTDALHQLRCIKDINGVPYYIADYGNRHFGFGIKQDNTSEPHVHHSRMRIAVNDSGKIKSVEYILQLAPEMQVIEHLDFYGTIKTKLNVISPIDLELANIHLTNFERWFDQVVQL